MKITATEFKENLKKYLEMAQREDVLITKNGKVIAKLTQPIDERREALRRLVGIAKVDDQGTIDLDNMRDERLNKQ